MKQKPIALPKASSHSQMRRPTLQKSGSKFSAQSPSVNSSAAYQRGVFTKGSDFSKNLNSQFERNEPHELLSQDDRKKWAEENSDSLKTQRIPSMNKMDGFDDGGSREISPSRLKEVLQSEEGAVRLLQGKIQALEDQISKVEYAHDTLRPLYKQLQAGPQSLFTQIQKTHQQALASEKNRIGSGKTLSPRDSEKQKQAFEQQKEVIQNFKIQVRESITANEDLVFRNIEAARNKKSEIDQQLGTMEQTIAGQIRDTQDSTEGDMNQLSQELHNKIEGSRTDLLEKFGAIQENFQRSMEQQRERVYSLQEKFQSFQKVIGQRLQKVEKNAEPGEALAGNEAEDLKAWLGLEVQKYIQSQTGLMKQNFAEQFVKAKESMNLDIRKIQEDLQNIQTHHENEGKDVYQKQGSLPEKVEKLKASELRESSQNVTQQKSSVVSDRNSQKPVAKTSCRNSPDKENGFEGPPSQKTSSSHLKTRVSSGQLKQFTEQIRQTLDQLESYSLKSSEEVNEEIEGLAGCISSNAEALEKSLRELQSLKRKSQLKEAEEGANKILQQFEQFNEYIKSQLVNITNAIKLRGKRCEGELKKLLHSLMPQQEALVRESGNGLGVKKELAKVEAFKEHMEALKKHINNTQQYLGKEAAQLEQKILEIQQLVIQEIEPFISACDYSAKEAKANNMRSQISAIPEEEAGENTYTEGDEQVEDDE